MIGIFYDDDGVPRMTGYAREGYETTDENESLKKTTGDDLVTIFENAKANGETLDGTNDPIDAAIDNPLEFLDYLILEDDEIVFDTGYTREKE